jgi:hypothetical protein
MTEDKILSRPRWTCTWACPVCGEVNIRHKPDGPLGLDSPEDLARRLDCGICQANAAECRAVVSLRPDHL